MLFLHVAPKGLKQFLKRWALITDQWWDDPHAHSPSQSPHLYSSSPYIKGGLLHVLLLDCQCFLEYCHISLLWGSKWVSLFVTMTESHGTVYKVSASSLWNSVAIIVKVPLEEGHLLRKWPPQGEFQVSSHVASSHEAPLETHRG